MSGCADIGFWQSPSPSYKLRLTYLPKRSCHTVPIGKGTQPSGAFRVRPNVKELSTCPGIIQKAQTVMPGWLRVIEARPQLGSKDVRGGAVAPFGDHLAFQSGSNEHDAPRVFTFRSSSHVSGSFYVTFHSESGPQLATLARSSLAWAYPRFGFFVLRSWLTIQSSIRFAS